MIFSSSAFVSIGVCTSDSLDSFVCLILRVSEVSIVAFFEGVLAVFCSSIKTLRKMPLKPEIS